MNSKKFVFLTIAIFFLAVLIPVMAHAKDITMSLNQSDYYFLLGEDANVILTMDNSYGKVIDGMFSYTIIQQLNQGGMSYSSSNTQSKSYQVPDGKNSVGLNFGTSNQQMTLKVQMSFNYNDGSDRTVQLGDINIHFVQDNNQKQNQQNQQTAKSQKTSEQQSQNSQQEEESIEEQLKQMQQQMNQMFGGNQQQQQPPNLQNNQLPQDSNALKQQMQQEMQQQQQMKQEFGKNLGQNQDFQQKHNDMLKQGYNLSSANFDPTNSTSGDFTVNYEKDGKQESIKGSMENNEIKEMSSSLDDKKLLQKLQNDSRYQKYDDELQKQGFSPQDAQVSRNGNLSNVVVPYTNEKNETALINGSLKSDEVKDVNLERDSKKRYVFWAVILGALIALILAVLIYKKYFVKKPEVGLPVVVEKPIDYKKEARKMLGEAEKLFSDKKEKDAYGMANSAIRFYYSHKLGIRAEITNSELINHLRKNRVAYTDTQKCVNLCSMVEFAKYVVNKEDFDEIIRLGERVVGMD